MMFEDQLEKNVIKIWLSVIYPAYGVLHDF